MFSIPTFDTLLNNILTDYRNKQGTVTAESLIRSACLASALWGAYKHQEYVSKQQFPDTADTAGQDHLGYVLNLPRLNGELNSAYASRLIAFMQSRPAGGNKNDYISWAMAIANVKAAYCFPNAQGLGTVDVLLMADSTATGSEVASSHTIAGNNTSVVVGKLVDSGANFLAALPVRKGDVVLNNTDSRQATVTNVDDATHLTLSSDIFTAFPKSYTIVSLCAQVFNSIDVLRPAGSRLVRALPTAILTQNVTVTVTGQNVNRSVISAAITALLNSLKPNDTLFVSTISAIAIQNGATNAVVTVPGADVVPGNYTTIRAGAVTVN